MYVATLTSPALEPSAAEALRNAWGGGDLQWLSPDEAAEFSLQDVPGTFREVWSDLQALKIDLNIQPSEGRRKKMLLADMDSTMIQQECIDELAVEAGVGDRVKDITARALDGGLGFEGLSL